VAARDPIPIWIAAGFSTSSQTTGKTVFEISLQTIQASLQRELFGTPVICTRHNEDAKQTFKTNF
jgi:hypothetical protein